MHPRQITLSLVKKLPSKLVGGENRRHTICWGIARNFVQGSSRDAGGICEKLKEIVDKEADP